MPKRSSFSKIVVWQFQHYLLLNWPCIWTIVLTILYMITWEWVKLLRTTRLTTSKEAMFSFINILCSIAWWFIGELLDSKLVPFLITGSTPLIGRNGRQVRTIKFNHIHFFIFFSVWLCTLALFWCRRSCFRLTIIDIFEPTQHPRNLQQSYHHLESSQSKLYPQNCSKNTNKAFLSAVKQLILLICVVVEINALYITSQNAANERNCCY